MDSDRSSYASFRVFSQYLTSPDTFYVLLFNFLIAKRKFPLVFRARIAILTTDSPVDANALLTSCVSTRSGTAAGPRMLS